MSDFNFFTNPDLCQQDQPNFQPHFLYACDEEDFDGVDLYTSAPEISSEE